MREPSRPTAVLERHLIHPIGIIHQIWYERDPYGHRISFQRRWSRFDWRQRILGVGFRWRAGRRFDVGIKIGLVPTILSRDTQATGIFCERVE